MGTEKQHWRKALYTIKQYTAPRVSELEAELAGMRSEYLQLELRASALLSERDRVREDLNKALQHIESVRAEHNTSIDRHERLIGAQQGRREASRKKLDRAQRQYRNLDRKLADRNEQIDRLEAAIEARRLREEELLAELEHLHERLTGAEQSHAAAASENRSLTAQLDKVRSEFEHGRETDSRQISRLEQRVIDIDAERQAAQRRVQLLETALAAASSRQDDITDKKVQALESKLDEQRKGYEADLHALRETLARVQAESARNADPLPTQGTPLARGGGRPPGTGVRSGAGGQRWRGNWAMLAAGFPLLLGALASATTFWDEGKNTREWLQLMTPLAESGKADGAVTDARQTGLGEEANGVQQVAMLQKTKRDRPRAVRRKPIVHGHWGPALFMQDKQAARKTLRVAFDPLVEQLQRDLLDMGFDLGQARADGLKGARTEQALDEFKALYLPQTGLQAAPSSHQLAVIIGNYAALARSDEQKFNVDRGVLAAIRLSSVRTGVDFSYLMELAAAESNFNPASKAVGSSARGLYQFTRETWLRTVKRHGDNYGLETYTAQIEYYVDRAGRRRPMVRDPDVLEHILELRHNPRVSAMMAAESVKENLNRLMFSFDREPGRTELYLAHFLGVDGAISFLKLLDNNPDKMAGDVFPGAAQSNRSIFHSQPCRPRTVNEIYEIFDRKFNTSRYEDFNPG